MSAASIFVFGDIVVLDGGAHEIEVRSASITIILEVELSLLSRIGTARTSFSLYAYI